MLLLADVPNRRNELRLLYVETMFEALDEVVATVPLLVDEIPTPEVPLPRRSLLLVGGEDDLAGEPEDEA